MSFKTNSVFVSHAGIPNGLHDRQDWQDYISDLDREIEMLHADWQKYESSSDVTTVDLNRFEAACDRLEEMRATAIQTWRSMRGQRPCIAS